MSRTRNWNNFEFPQSAGTTKLMQGSEYSAKSPIFENVEEVISQKDIPNNKSEPKETQNIMFKVPFGASLRYGDSDCQV